MFTRASAGIRKIQRPSAWARAGAPSRSQCVHCEASKEEPRSRTSHGRSQHTHDAAVHVTASVSRYTAQAGASASSSLTMAKSTVSRNPSTNTQEEETQERLQGSKPGTSPEYVHVHKGCDTCTCRSQQVACLGSFACMDSSSRRPAGWSSSMLRVSVVEKQPRSQPLQQGTRGKRLKQCFRVSMQVSQQCLWCNAA